METLFYWFALPAMYLAPGLIAWGRGHHNWRAILMLNVLAGWTVIGWVIAIVWAMTAVRPAEAPVAASVNSKI